MEKDASKESTESTCSYNVEYYRANKTVIQSNRKTKYDTDPEYRKKCQDYAKERKRKLREARKASGEGARKRGALRPTVFHIEYEGEKREVVMFSVGALAKKFGRMAQTMRLWERTGILPPALYRKETGERLYTEWQVEKMVEAYAEAKEKDRQAVKTRISKTTFPAAVKAIWEEYPLGIDPN